MANTFTQCWSLLPCLWQWVSLRSIPTVPLPSLWHWDQGRGRTCPRVRRRSVYQPSTPWHRASHRAHICCRWLPRVLTTGCEAGHRCRPCSETPHCSLPPQSGWQGALLAGLVGGATFLKNRREGNPNLLVLLPARILLWTLHLLAFQQKGCRLGLSPLRVLATVLPSASQAKQGRTTWERRRHLSPAIPSLAPLQSS